MENNRFKVNIYTYCSIKGPGKRKGCCMWLVEYLTSKNIPVTRQGMIKEDDTTENRLTLEAIIEALKMLSRNCEIRINTPCEHVLNTAGNNWHVQWQMNDWKNAKGKDVKNADLWENYMLFTRNHVVSFETGDHSYSKVMKSEVEKTAKILVAEGC